MSDWTTTDHMEEFAARVRAAAATGGGLIARSQPKPGPAPRSGHSAASGADWREVVGADAARAMLHVDEVDDEPAWRATVRGGGGSIAEMLVPGLDRAVAHDPTLGRVIERASRVQGGIPSSPPPAPAWREALGEESARAMIEEMN